MALSARRSARLEDPGADLIASVGGFWDRYGRIVLGVGIGAAAIGAIVFLTLRSRAASESQAAGRLAEASVLYWQGDYARSLQLAKQVAQEFPSTASGNDAHRLAGDNAYWDGDFKTAVTEYRAYLSKQKTGILADAARRSLAYALESNKQYPEAATEYEGLVGKLDRESSAEFLADAARSYRAANRPADAKKALQRLIDEFGDTTFADRARIDLAELNTATQ